MNVMTEAEKAWVAGIIEGEGSVLWATRQDRVCGTAFFVVFMTDYDVIQRLQAWTGLGTINAPRNPSRAGGKQGWRWQVTKQEDWLALADAIEPYLLARRAAKLREVRALLLAYRSRPRDNRRGRPVQPATNPVERVA